MFKFLILLIALLTPFTLAADIRLNAGFETSTIQDYYLNISNNAYGITIQNKDVDQNPVCSGSKSVRSLLEHGRGSVWSQVTLNQQPFNSFEIGKRHWISFAIYLPDDYTPDTAEEVLWELHGRADTHDGELWRNAPLAIRTNGDQWVISYKKDSKYITYTATSPKDYEEEGAIIAGKFLTGKWTRFVIDTFWDYRSQGYAKVWIDDDLKLNKTNGIGYNDTKGPFLKIGVYKSKWDANKSWGGPTSVSSRTIYFDDLKIGDGNETYNQMVPNCVDQALPDPSPLKPLNITIDFLNP